MNGMNGKHMVCMDSLIINIAATSEGCDAVAYGMSATCESARLCGPTAAFVDNRVFLYMPGLLKGMSSRGQVMCTLYHGKTLEQELEKMFCLSEGAAFVVSSMEGLHINLSSIRDPQKLFTLNYCLELLENVAGMDCHYAQLRGNLRALAPYAVPRKMYQANGWEVDDKIRPGVFGLKKLIRNPNVKVAMKKVERQAPNLRSRSEGVDFLVWCFKSGLISEEVLAKYVRKVICLKYARAMARQRNCVDQDGRPQVFLEDKIKNMPDDELCRAFLKVCAAVA